MKPNKFEDSRIGKAMEELRSEAVPMGPKGRAFDAMVGFRSRRMRLPTIASAGAAVLVSVVLLWPGRRAMGWQQVVQSTLSPRRLHHADFIKGARRDEWIKIADEWIDGDKEAMQAHPFEGQNSSAITLDWREDGKRTYRLQWTGYGEVYNTKRRRNYDEWTRRFSMAGLLTDSRLKIDKTPTEVLVDGKTVLRYTGKAYEGPVNMGFYNKIVFYAEKDSGRIIRTEKYDNAGTGKMSEYSIVDYPNAVDPKIFMPPTDGPKVFDLDRDASALKESITKGVAIGHGNVLRAAMASPTGDLVVLWTGAPPNGDGTQRPVAVGNPTKSVYAPDQITASRWKVNPKAMYLCEGQPLCGLALQLKAPISAAVSLRIPILVLNPKSPIRNSKGAVVGYRSKQVGMATVKDFPVIHTIPFSVLEYTRGNLEN